MFMQKSVLTILILGFLFIASTASAQFRSVPGAVTDSFKIRYPNAKSVSWRDNVSAFQATFKLDSATYVAKYSSKAEWQSSETKIRQDAIPAAVKDGLSKSKYADWKIGTVTVRYLPGNKTEYVIFVSKSDINRKNLTFSSEGQLLKDSITL
jgi:hypothetical protein